jgi:hypothetical protein
LTRSEGIASVPTTSDGISAMAIRVGNYSLIAAGGSGSGVGHAPAIVGVAIAAVVLLVAIATLVSRSRRK